MRQLFTLVFLCVTFTSMGQLIDNFSDGNFTSNPTWSGDDSLWKVSNGFLNSNCFTANKSFYLSTANTRATNTEWRFRCHLSFNTSSANYVDYYLTANNSSLLATSLSGYFVRVGNTKDEIALYKNVAGTETLIIDGTDGVTNVSTSDFVVKTTQDNGKWKLYIKDLNTPSPVYLLQDSAVDNTLTTSSYAGVKVKQSTSSFFEKHFFTDFYIGNIIVDNAPPIIDSAKALSSTSVDLFINEAVKNNINKNMFDLGGVGAPATAALDNTNPAIIHLTFASPFSQGNKTITYQGLEDLNGNINNNGQIIFVWREEKYGDVLINEVYPDYNPTHGLPEYKFVELYNKTISSIDLSGWTLREGTKSMSIPAVSIPSNGYVILVGSSTAATAYASYGTCASASNFPTLSVSGSSLALYNDGGRFIHGMSYDANSYRNAVKAEGGYSLELTDKINACNYYDAWQASNANIGGTPGAVNSIDSTMYPNTPLMITSVEIITDSIIELSLNKYLVTNGSSISASVIINNTVYNISNLFNTEANKLRVRLPFALEQNKIYTAEVKGGITCNGQEEDCFYDFGKPSVLDSGDLRLTEILFDSKMGYNDFIELYNPTNKVFKIANVSLASRDDNGNISDVTFMDNKNFILPGKYYVISKDYAARISEVYQVPNPTQVIPVSFSYSLNSDKDAIVLMTTSGKILDEVAYDSKWHFGLLNDTKGISLERVSLAAPTQDANNWHSSSESAGFATPTGMNSSNISSTTASDKLSINHSTISPDGDGKDDFILINYNLGEPGYLLTSKVFSLAGILMATISDREAVSTDGFIKWDGFDNNQNKIDAGSYILFLEAYNTKGSKINKKININVR